MNKYHHVLFRIKVPPPHERHGTENNICCFFFTNYIADAIVFIIRTVYVIYRNQIARYHKCQQIMFYHTIDNTKYLLDKPIDFNKIELERFYFITLPNLKQ